MIRSSQNSEIGSQSRNSVRAAANSTCDDVQERWTNLPDDLLRDVFGRLSPRELARVGCVAKSWRDVANEAELWRGQAAALRRPTTGAAAKLKAACRHAVLTDANLRAGRITAQRTIRHESSFFGVLWSPDGSKLATASDDGTARIFDAISGAEQARINVAEWVDYISWSPDGSKLAAASRDGTARIFDVTGGVELARMTHANWVRRVSWSPDGRRLASASGDRTARIFDATSGAELARITHADSVRSVSWNLDGSKLASVACDGTARTFDATSGAELARFSDANWVDSVSWSPDGSKLASWSHHAAARILDAISGAELARIVHDGSIHSVSWSPDCSKLASASFDGTVRITEFGPAPDRSAPPKLAGLLKWIRRHVARGPHAAKSGRGIGDRRG